MDNLKLKEEIVKIALREYENSKPFENEDDKLEVMDMLENVYIMCAKWNIEGIQKIQEILLKEKDIYIF
jgi:hypothetical protein